MGVSEWTSLPNWHPALVHFPLALIFTAFTLDLGGLALRRHRWLEHAAVLLWCLAALGAAAAYLTGRWAVDGLGLIEVSAQSAVGAHADAAWWTLIGASVYALARVGLIWVTRHDPTVRRLGLRALFSILGLGVLAGVAVTADRGGALVFHHALGVRQAPVHEEHAVEARAEEPAAPSPDAPAEQTIDIDVDPERSLMLDVDGRLFALFGEEFADLSAEATLNIADFAGAVGLVHHYSDASNFSAFEVAGSRRSLLHSTEGTARRLDSQNGDRPVDAVSLSVSSIGRHVKGYIDGKTVVHGHVDPLPAGRVGLLFDGRGSVRVLDFRVETASGH